VDCQISKEEEREEMMVKNGKRFVKGAWKKYKKWEADAPKRREEGIEKQKQRVELAKLQSEERKHKAAHRPKSTSGGFGLGTGSLFSAPSYFGPPTTPKPTKVAPKRKKRTKKKKRRVVVYV